MQVIFRVDSSHKIGGGHLTRCLNLANYLIKRGISSLFICQELVGFDKKLLENSFHKFKLLPATDNLIEDARNTSDLITQEQKETNTLIIDHYRIDFEWETFLKNYVNRLIIIDDLANKLHNCDVLINQVYNVEKKIYKNLVNDECKLFLGSKYIMLKNNFKKIRETIDFEKLDQKITNIHLFFSTSDELGLTIKYSKLLTENFPNINLHISVGNQFKYLEKLIELQKKTNRIFWIKNNSNMEKQMSYCQVAIGTPGMTTWERACLGLPSMQMGITDYHDEIMNKLSDYGICNWLGHVNKLNDEIFINKCKLFFKDKLSLKKMSKKCLNTVDGEGMERIYRIISKKG
ncbi:UDP-2,4-diacetamido-2,4,6-trideoxy-beta-L-altropyranose hydrolase [Prochlorococcus sp. AH-716-D13]|nr:UDP-2,4-diacetamido-2,4,6-trideoxy-beta-L-altropyranose hydrolase [Prochlorococcus sp. AH-716-D13]